MDNPEKLVTQSTQDEEKHSKNTTQHVSNNATPKQTRTTLHTNRHEQCKQVTSPSTNNWRQRRTEHRKFNK